MLLIAYVSKSFLEIYQFFNLTAISFFTLSEQCLFRVLWVIAKFVIAT